MNEYKDKIGKLLWELPINGVFNINRYVAPENQYKFIAIVKTYIDRNYGTTKGWEILLNENYTEVKKYKKHIANGEWLKNDRLRQNSHNGRK